MENGAKQSSQSHTTHNITEHKKEESVPQIDKKNEKLGHCKYPPFFLPKRSVWFFPAISVFWILVGEAKIKFFQRPSSSRTALTNAFPYNYEVLTRFRVV